MSEKFAVTVVEKSVDSKQIDVLKQSVLRNRRYGHALDRSVFFEFELERRVLASPYFDSTIPLRIMLAVTILAMHRCFFDLSENA